MHNFAIPILIEVATVQATVGMARAMAMREATMETATATVEMGMAGATMEMATAMAEGTMAMEMATMEMATAMAEGIMAMEMAMVGPLSSHPAPCRDLVYSKHNQILLSPIILDAALVPAV